MKNPFQYGKVAESENFINRNADRTFLKQMLLSGINVILVSPRRWGKSSLVKKAMGELLEEERNIHVCFIDAFPITSVDEFYKVFAKEVLRSTATHWQTIIKSVKKLFKSVVPKISFGTDPANDFSISFEMSGQTEEEQEILELPEKIALSRNIQIIVCIDEFQELAKLNGYAHLEEMMRSVWQHQQHVSYCLYGSQRHMMSEIFDSPEKPFYRFGQIYNLKKISVADWTNYIHNRFSITGKDISDDLALQIVSTVKCHSWYVQQLSSAVWNFTENVADDNAFKSALTWSIDVNKESYERLCGSLSPLQLNLLKAIANGEEQLSSISTIKNYHLGSSASVIKNKSVLASNDIISVSKTGIEFLDPLFGIWFSQNYK